MAFEDPTTTQQESFNLKTATNVADFVFIMLFFLEMLLKIAAGESLDACFCVEPIDPNACLSGGSDVNLLKRGFSACSRCSAPRSLGEHVAVHRVPIGAPEPTLEARLRVNRCGRGHHLLLHPCSGWHRSEPEGLADCCEWASTWCMTLHVVQRGAIYHRPTASGILLPATLMTGGTTWTPFAWLPR
jgi:hypothetical protein